MTKKTNLNKHFRQMQINVQPSLSDESIVERERLLEEKESIKQCLAICAKGLEHLRQFQNEMQINDKFAAEREKESTILQNRAVSGTVPQKAKESLSQTAARPEHFHGPGQKLP